MKKEHNSGISFTGAMEWEGQNVVQISLSMSLCVWVDNCHSLVLKQLFPCLTYEDDLAVKILFIR